MILFKKASYSTLVLVATVALMAVMAGADGIEEEPAVEVVSDTAVTEVVTPSEEKTDRVIAYYLHGDRRCATCIKLEAYSREAIEAGFVSDLEAGGLVWRVVNFEDEGNEHFVDDYELYTKAVILSRISDGKETGWKNLDKIWELVGDQEKFTEYVQSETEAFLSQESE